MADFNVLKRGELEKSLGKTIYSSYKAVMDKYIISNLQDGGSFSVPIVQVLVGESDKLKARLLDLYHRKMATVDTSHIDEEIKILQASAFDGLLLGLNVEKGMQMAIYTANPNAIFHFDGDSKFSLDKTLDLNEQGIINAVRIDIEYTSEEGFTFKPVSLNKNTNLKVYDTDTMEGRFFLVPYIAIQRSMAFFKEMLDDGRILKVTQDKDGIAKVRHICSRKSELVKYLDHKDFADDLFPEYFPLKGYFYAPVLGASSMTLGKTRVDILDVNKVELVTKPNIVKEDSLGDFIREKAMASVLSDMYKNDIEGYVDVVSKIPNKDKVFGDMSDYPKPFAVLAYYRQIPSKDKSNLLKSIPNIDTKISELMSLIDRFDKIDVKGKTSDDLRGFLKSGLYKVLIRKKNCEYSTMFVTNSRTILAKAYGKDYFKNYESFGTRLYKLEDLYNIGWTMSEAMCYCGFEDKLHFSYAAEEILAVKDNKASVHERLASLLGEEEDGTKKKVNRSAKDEDLILCRDCFAEYGSSNYYRYLDLNKIVSIIQVGV